MFLEWSFTSFYMQPITLTRPLSKDVASGLKSAAVGGRGGGFPFKQLWPCKVLSGSRCPPVDCGRSAAAGPSSSCSGTAAARPRSPGSSGWVQTPLPPGGGVSSVPSSRCTPSTSITSWTVSGPPDLSLDDFALGVDTVQRKDKDILRSNIVDCGEKCECEI